MSEDTSTDSKTKLRQAALDLIAEQGFKGATTRKIAERAGVNEVTLFRLFGNKLNLVIEAVTSAAHGFQKIVAKPSGDLEADLETLATSYHAFVMLNKGAVVRLIPEIGSNGKFGKLAQPVLKKTVSKVVGLFEHYQELGLLCADEAENLALAFLGPLIARALLADVFESDMNFDSQRYVKLYLEGRLLKN